jgi:hypothetical protein
MISVGKRRLAADKIPLRMVHAWHQIGESGNCIVDSDIDQIGYFQTLTLTLT